MVQISREGYPLTIKEDLVKFHEDYASNLFKNLYALSIDSLGAAIEAIYLASIAKKRIYVAGNGGSAAIANHLCCDFSKGTYLANTGNPIKTKSLSSNICEITAIANDMSYEDSFYFQLKIDLDEAYPEDNDYKVIVLISSSGNSPNIVKAAKYAKEKGLTIIGLTGFSGGRLKELSDISLHIPENNYGIVEDCHQSIMHIIAQYILKLNKETLVGV